MAQLERPQRHVEASTKTPTIHTMEQLLRAGEASKPKLSPNNSNASSSSSSSSSPSSPFFQRLRHHDSEDDHGQKKSVLTKVKEKARKLRHSLSKKKHEDGNSGSPSSGAGLEGDVEEDAEYHGAPMYESEKAPEGYKENAKQHAKASPVIPEKHAMSSNDKSGMEQDREKTLTRSLSKRITQPPTATPAATAAATLSSPKKTMTKTETEKNLKPAYAEGSETGHSITPKIQGLTVSKPGEHDNSSSSSRAAPTTTHNTSLSIVPPRTPPAKMPSQTCSSAPPTSSLAPLITTPPPTPPASAPPSGKNASQIWDKGVSVKEYLMNKFEPGEDERALSRVISEAMSPRRTPGDAGVMEKVREAVTSLLRNDEPTKYVDAIAAPTTHTSSQIAASTNNTTRASSQVPLSQTAASTNNTTRASSQVPLSSNAREVVQEENHGRILQAN